MTDNDTDETETPAFAGVEVLEEAHGESPPLSHTNPAVKAALEKAIKRAKGRESDEGDPEGEVAGGDFAEDASGSTGEGLSASDTTLLTKLSEEGKAAAEAAIEALEAAGVPTIDTNHELAAYTSGYRAGGDDPGWLLTLAELGRHLGSFFEPEEEVAFEALSAEEFWSRWTLGYLDAAAGRMARPERPRKREEMDW